MPSVTNISAYLFAPLVELRPLREKLVSYCQANELKGTILLSREGINLFVAGARENIDELLSILRAVPGLEALSPKRSESEEQPFSRMLVKIKKEIIAFGVEGIDPARRPSPKLSPRELKQWLDEGRPLTLLDTRNDYEVRLGTFRNALPLGIDHFRDFPEAVRTLPEELKKQPIVMFCTGGIRCEKAGPYMEREGFQQIFQLDGGILKYFEEVGGDHYEGECFVFDKRVGVDPGLQESGKTQCFVCQSPLNEDEQADPRFAVGVSCPHCFRSGEELTAIAVQLRQQRIRESTAVLPGSLPADNYRPFKVSAIREGFTLLEFLRSIRGHSPEGFWESQIEKGFLLDESRRPVNANCAVKAGERYLHWQPANIEPEVNAAIELLHEDEAIIVVNKPAPLPVHPSGRFHRNTLLSILLAAYAPQKPRPAHRLDANTTGVVVFTRSAHFAKFLQPQFERQEVEKLYLARVIGHPPRDAFSCERPISSDPGVLGSRVIDEDKGLPARTDFRVLRRIEDGTSLLEVVPRSGRTNQIRVHLWDLGWPILGDQAYLPDRKLGDTQTHHVGDPPLCLHALRLTFIHPSHGERVTFEAPLPDWGK